MFLRILKKDDWLQRINIPEGTVKISVYAYDLVIFCADEGDINKTSVESRQDPDSLSL